MSTGKPDSEATSIGPPLQSFDCESVPVTRGGATRTRGRGAQQEVGVRGAGEVRMSAEELENLLRAAASLPLAQRVRLVQELVDGLPAEERSRLADSLRHENEE